MFFAVKKKIFSLENIYDARLGIFVALKNISVFLNKPTDQLNPQKMLFLYRSRY
jgi:hypothetical protein